MDKQNNSLSQKSSGFKHFNVTELVKSGGFHSGVDKEFDTHVLDEDAEDRLLDEMEGDMAGVAGGNIVDFHSSELFPERWFDLVLVLKAGNTAVFDRLKARGYSKKKVEENVTAEIMNVCEEEARDAFADGVVHAVSSSNLDDQRANIDRLKSWVQAWCGERDKRRAAGIVAVPQSTDGDAESSSGPGSAAAGGGGDTSESSASGSMEPGR